MYSEFTPLVFWIGQFADTFVSSPFHAHGQHFYDIGSGNGTYNATENEAKIVKAGYHPVQRDTSMLYRYITTTKAGLDAGWRAWRIRVDQPGVWLIHCHTLQHMMMGRSNIPQWSFISRI